MPITALLGPIVSITCRVFASQGARAAAQHGAKEGAEEAAKKAASEAAKEAATEAGKKGIGEVAEAGAEAGAEVVENGFQSAPPKLAAEMLDKGVDQLFGEKGRKAVLEAMNGFMESTGGSILKSALATLSPDLADSIGALVKGGNFSSLKDDQLKTLGKAFVEVARLMI